jgi:hypothetical protein
MALACSYQSGSFNIRQRWEPRRTKHHAPWKSVAGARASKRATTRALVSCAGHAGKLQPSRVRARADWQNHHRPRRGLRERNAPRKLAQPTLLLSLLSFVAFAGAYRRREWRIRRRNTRLSRGEPAAQTAMPSNSPLTPPAAPPAALDTTSPSNSRPMVPSGLLHISFNLR